ncbi:glycosyltransferase [Vibrio makurazakiensis]|uniref:glycosyltransferase n=1 Tax=Vibrio makurazakiensis TaxID=2910250 RepID=UPI003D146E7F
MRDLIVFGEDFGGLPSSTQHLVRHLSRTHKVLWINSIGLRQPQVCTKDILRAFNKLLGQSHTQSQNMMQLSSEFNITIANLRTIPAPKSAIARQLAKNMLLSQLRPLMTKLNMKNPILWTSLPTAADLCGELGESAVVYYCGDDFEALAGVDHKTVREHEKRLVNKANLVFAVSDKLMKKFPRCKTQLLPHGVDVELFSTPAPRASDLPSPHRPIAGFYGSLSKWLNYPLIDQVSAQLPEWDFVFIGPNELNTLELPSRSNVHYLGPKAHSELPQYSQHWDVSLLPFVDNDQIQACSPLKLLEYLAAGSQIIATPFPALKPYAHHIDIVNTAQDMVEALRSVQTKQPLPRDIVTEESWEKRSQFVGWMLELL